MRIMSKEGRCNLALVQLGPTAPWDTGQTGHKGPSLPGLFTLQGEQRAAMMMDDGAAGRLKRTSLKGRSEACGSDYLEAQGVGSMRNFVNKGV